MQDTKPVMAFLGIGLMGGPMARRLLGAGYAVRAWNRNPDKARALQADGATAFGLVTDAVRGADIVITMLADGPAVDDVLRAKGVLSAMRAGATLIDMSSIDPPTARLHEKAALDNGLGYLDAPVSGGTAGAAAGTLAIMVGGNIDTFQSVTSVFAPMGHATHVGPAGSGQLAKLCNQTIVAITIGAVSEALYLAERGGADPAAVRQALRGGFADSRILELHGERIVQGNFVPGGRSSFQLKDLNNVHNVSEALGVDLPMTELVRSRFQRLVDDLGGADLDHSALHLELKDRNKS